MRKEDGIATDFHFAHYRARALGGVSLIITESTAVLPDGLITKNDLGLLDNPGLCEYLVQTKQVDLILQARALLRNPNWVMKAATALHDHDYQAYNASYERARL